VPERLLALVKITTRTISLVATVILLAFTFALTTAYLNHPPNDPVALLGIQLPGGASEPQVLVVSQAPTTYHAYIRFEIAPHQVSALLADANFQPAQSDSDPLAQLERASLRNQSIATLAVQDRPAWWSPQPGKSYLLAQRSRTSPSQPYTGPDGSWYILDTSQPSRVTVYVFVVEG
jgi:hypothetical protein